MFDILKISPWLVIFFSILLLNYIYEKRKIEKHEMLLANYPLIFELIALCFLFAESIPTDIKAPSLLYLLSFVISPLWIISCINNHENKFSSISNVLYIFGLIVVSINVLIFILGPTLLDINVIDFVLLKNIGLSTIASDKYALLTLIPLVGSILLMPHYYPLQNKYEGLKFILRLLALGVFIVPLAGILFIIPFAICTFSIVYFYDKPAKISHIK